MNKITTQRALRRAFWEQYSWLDRRRRVKFDATERTFSTDTRVCFGEWIDTLAREGVISAALAQRATL